MGADRKKYVMSVEMAIQREMAFRKKLENLKPEKCSNSTVIIPQSYPLHSHQVQSSTLTQIPTTPLTPGLNQIPCRPTQVTVRPAPYTRPTATYAPPQRPNSPYPGLTQPSRPTRHALVTIPNPTPAPYRPTPAQAPPHRPNPPRSGLTRPSRPIHQAHQHRRPPPIHVQAKRLKVYSPEDFYCELCQSECNSEINFRMHLKGHKHKSMLNKVVEGTTMSEANDKQVFCELCKVWCPDTNAFTLHLNGKNHFLKLHASEMKLKGPVGATSMS